MKTTVNEKYCEICGGPCASISTDVLDKYYGLSKNNEVAAPKWFFDLKLLKGYTPSDRNSIKDIGCVYSGTKQFILFNSSDGLTLFDNIYGTYKPTCFIVHSKCIDIMQETLNLKKDWLYWAVFKSMKDKKTMKSDDIIPMKRYGIKKYWNQFFDYKSAREDKVCFLMEPEKGNSNYKRIKKIIEKQIKPWVNDKELSVYKCKPLMKNEYFIGQILHETNKNKKRKIKECQNNVLKPLNKKIKK